MLMVLLFLSYFLKWKRSIFTPFKNGYLGGRFARQIKIPASSSMDIMVVQHALNTLLSFNNEDMFGNLSSKPCFHGNKMTHFVMT
jgi:hypothetical protein